MPPDVCGAPVNSPRAVIATRVSRRPSTRASRNRSFETQPATARWRSSPPLKPRSCPPPFAGRSMTTVWLRAQPSAVAVPERLSVRTSKFIRFPHSARSAGQHGSNRGRLIKQSPVMVNGRFARATWGLVAFLLAVVAWGAFVRATGSGAGCGAHWPVCNGQVLPRAPALETIIEFSHRVSSGLVTLAVLVWAVWGFLAFPRGHRVRRGAVLGVLAILAEGAIGAALVLFRLTGKDDSLTRAAVMGLHLVNTFFLLAVVALTGAWAGGVGRLRLRDQGVVAVLVPAALLGLVVLGVSGGVAALGDTLFPASSLTEGFRQDVSGGAHVLLRLRILHPLIAVAVGTLLLVTAGVCGMLRPGRSVRRTAVALAALVVVQLTAGMVNLVLLAPVWMQLVHLLLADAVWLAAVLLGGAALAEDAPRLSVPGLVEPGSASVR